MSDPDSEFVRVKTETGEAVVSRVYAESTDGLTVVGDVETPRFGGGGAGAEIPEKPAPPSAPTKKKSPTGGSTSKETP